MTCMTTAADKTNFFNVLLQVQLELSITVIQQLEKSGTVSYSTRLNNQVTNQAILSSYKITEIYITYLLRPEQKNILL